MAAVLRCGIWTFRALNGPLSGEVHVSGGTSRAKGARKRGSRAKSRSLEPCAGPDDGSGMTAGGSARTSAAPPAARETSGGSANGGGNETKRAPNPEKEQLKEMPGTAWAFTKAVDEGVQLVGVMQGLLKSEDEKVRLRAFELWVELAFGKHAGGKEEERGPEIGWRLPRPERD
ncbi:MAG TPA: hypothetical protein VGR58_03430 [Candidatus Acidoferrum sp.]|nr:hypothetical protein [Candidatus Acidoferrum sp.]